MADLIRFVDSIDASPAVRLDLNDEAYFWTKRFDAALPRLRRSMSSNAMRDGISVGSATYDGRTLVIELEMIQATQDIQATWLQKLWRELDRPTNLLMYQPNGLTKPVFFRTFRSDASQLEDVMAQAAMRRFTIEVLAEPFALGLRETLGPFTVNNDPAALANGLFITLATVIGDAPAPAVVQMVHGSASFAALFLSMRHDAAATDLIWQQAESMSLGVDTTNPGGGPDAAMSGTGTNNFCRTSFATASMQTRLTPALNVLRGSYRLLAVVRRSDATSVMSARVVSNGTTGPTVPIPATTNRQIVDLGVFSYSRGALDKVGYSTASSSASVSVGTVNLQAARASGSGTLDWDFVAWLPADESTLVSSGSATVGLLVDSILEAPVPYVPGGDPFAGTSSANGNIWPAAGGYPYVIPGEPNRMTILHSRAAGHVLGDQATVHVHYWPRYQIIRPISS